MLAVKDPSLDMTTASGRSLAGLLGEFDTMKSEIKSEWQKIAAAQAARRGERWKGGHRPFGWQPDTGLTARPHQGSGSRRGSRTEPVRLRMRMIGAVCTERTPGAPESPHQEGLFPMTTARPGPMDVTPYRLSVPQSALDDLHRRLGDTRWPAALPGDD